MAPKRSLAVLFAAAAAAGVSVTAVQSATAHREHHRVRSARLADATRTPIKHVVVIFQENVSFDHYFGTYPTAANTDGQSFTARPGTPAVDGLLPATASSLPPQLRHSTNLITTNPNLAPPRRLNSTVNGAGRAPGGQLTCDQDHSYSDEQQAFDKGRMDHFVQSTGDQGGTGPAGGPCEAVQVMDYYDGNTVTGLWNYAQHFAMSDNSYGSTFGPSAPGAINLASGDTGGVDMSHIANNPSISTSTSPDGDLTPDGTGGYSLTSDAQPYWDDCSTRDAVAMTGQNIGDVLNRAGLSWGWFQGGERPSTSYQAGLAMVGKTGQPTSTFIENEFSSIKNPQPGASSQGLCDTFHPIGAALGGTGQYGYKDDYVVHHNPFDFYASTANPHHLTLPTNAQGQDTMAGLQEIGHDTQSYVNGASQFDTPNHNYDTSDFNQLVAAITQGRLPASALPAVSFLKAPGYEDGHGGYSDPADEQQFIVRTVNELERSPDWRNTVVIVNYDDSDGWYDHVYSGVTNPSVSPADNLTDTHLTLPTSGRCGPAKQTTAPLGGQQGRCGLGPRLPMIVISPWAKDNYVDHNVSDQSSIINLIEYNWNLPGIPGSFDQALAATDRAEGVPFDLAGMFDFSHRGSPRRLFLNPSTGQPNG
jgi:phospholipase C